MSQSAVTRHLEAKFQQVELSQEHAQSLKNIIVKRKESIKEALETKKIITPAYPRPISPYIKQLQNAQQAQQKINEAIRYQRLKEAEKIKKQLKNKLDTIQHSIEVLGSIDLKKEKEKMEELRIARLKANREKSPNKEDMEHENELKKKAAEFAKAQLKQQKMRRQMYEQYMKENQCKLEAEMQSLEEMKKQEYEQKKEEKIQKIKQKQLELEQRQNERKQQLERNKQEMKQFKLKKPLYKDIEERYQQEIQMPELEKRKEELQKRRQLYSSVRSSDILEHSKQYENKHYELKQKRERDRKEKELEFKVSQINTKYNTSVLKQLIEKERKIKEKDKNTKNLKIELIQKRTRYGELIKSMYTPVPSLSKKLELERLNETSYTKPREIRMLEIRKEAKD